jgi:hypothetical protein
MGGNGAPPKRNRIGADEMIDGNSLAQHAARQIARAVIIVAAIGIAVGIAIGLLF